MISQEQQEAMGKLWKHRAMKEGHVKRFPDNTQRGSRRGRPSAFGTYRKFLAGGPKTAEQIANLAGRSKSAVRESLENYIKEGKIGKYRQSVWIYYFIVEDAA